MFPVIFLYFTGFFPVKHLIRFLVIKMQKFRFFVVIF